MPMSGTSVFVKPLARNKLAAARAWSRLAASEEQRDNFADQLAAIARERWCVRWEEAEITLQRQVIRAVAGASTGGGAPRQPEAILELPCIICDGRVIRVEEIPPQPRIVEDAAYLAAKIAKYLDWGSCIISGSDEFAEHFNRYCLHERDFRQWALETAQALRGRRPDGVDWESVAAEIELLAEAGRSGPHPQLVRLLRQLLQMSVKPQGAKRRARSQASIDDARARIQRLIEGGNLPRDTLPASMEEAYVEARIRTIRKLGLPEDSLPESCLWSVEQALDHEFWPQADGKPN